MEEARQELKNLMNDLFVEDLKMKASELSNSIATHFQGAVDEFKEGFDEMVEVSVNGRVEPKFTQVTQYHDALQKQITESNNFMQEGSRDINEKLGSIKGDADQLKKDQDAKLSEIKNSLEANTKSLSNELGSAESRITANISETKNDLFKTVQDFNLKTILKCEEQTNRSILAITDGKNQITTALSNGIEEITALKVEIGKNREEITSALGEDRKEISAVKVEINKKITELENKITKEEQIHNKYNFTLTALMILNVILVMVLLFRN